VKDAFATVVNEADEADEANFSLTQIASRSDATDREFYNQLLIGCR